MKLILADITAPLKKKIKRAKAQLITVVDAGSSEVSRLYINITIATIDLVKAQLITVVEAGSSSGSDLCVSSTILKEV